MLLFKISIVGCYTPKYLLKRLLSIPLFTEPLSLLYSQGIA